MWKAINKAIAKLQYESSLDEIKSTLKEEMAKTGLNFSNDDWNYMFDAVILGLRDKKFGKQVYIGK